MDILEFLISNGIINQDQLAEIQGSLQTGNSNLESQLLELGISTQTVRSAFASFYGVDGYVLQPGESISYEVLSYIPEDSARHYKILPLKISDSILLVGANNPDDLQMKEVLNFITAKHGVSYQIVFMLRSDIETAMEQYESLTGEVDDALYSLQEDKKNKEGKDKWSQRRAQASAKADGEHIKEDAPVTKIVASILRYAVDGGASDIHIEPTETKVVVRFRVDGSLVHSLELPKNTHSAVVARVKILSSMRLDEKRKPQDGRFSSNFDDRKIDFRVSLFPTNRGEKVVMRILDNEKGITTLESTGISTHHLDAIRRAISEPYGIILISGPTGSGKSTTLYTMLSEIDRETKNVLSLEDPVEYNIEGVSQSQMRPEIGYTFANGLRAALRQDPDIIMVGEIRDKETAQLAIQAALTGHLVLSTIHTNNSIGVIPRLIDMGIDPYLIAPTLKLAIAQRLAKRVCTGTGIEKPIDKAMQAMMEREFETLPERFRGRIPTNNTMLDPESTPECTTGMKGRVAVMEALEVDDMMQEMILDNASEEKIYRHARERGFMSMKEDAIIKALQHVIPKQEVSLFGTKVGVENLTEGLIQDIDLREEESGDNQHFDDLEVEIGPDVDNSNKLDS